MNKKTIDKFKQSRRTQKIVETLAERQNRENAFLNRLDEIADNVLSGKKSTMTDSELQAAKIKNPELFGVCESLFEVADKMNKL